MTYLNQAIDLVGAFLALLVLLLATCGLLYLIYGFVRIFLHKRYWRKYDEKQYWETHKSRYGKDNG